MKNTKARVKLAGRLRHLRKETTRISRVIEKEFERIEPDQGKPGSESAGAKRERFKKGWMQLSAEPWITPLVAR